MNNRKEPSPAVSHRTCFKVSLVLLYLFVSLFSALEAGAISCHCFRERTFNPVQPASADPYILATTRNSLLAAASGIDKAAVVRQRMTGASETDLWLSLYLSTLVDRTPDLLLEARDSSSSWSAAFDAVDLQTGKLGTAFQGAREAGKADGMARALADTVLGKAFKAGETTLERLRDNDASIAESTLSLYLSGRLKRTPESLLKDVKTGSKTWGGLLNSLDIRFDEIGDLIAEEVKQVNSE
jgi:hypothetical protein